MEGLMEDLVIDLGDAAAARRDAYVELMCIDTPEGEGSPMLAEKLCADAAMKFTKVAQDLISEANALSQRRERLLREHPESFGARKS